MLGVIFQAWSRARAAVLFVTHSRERAAPTTASTCPTAWCGRHDGPGHGRAHQDVVAPIGLRSESVSKRYATPAGTIEAVRDVDLVVSRGAAWPSPARVGAASTLSGSSAASTRRPLVGSSSGRTSSRCSLSDADRSRVRRVRAGFVFQSDNLLPFLTEPRTSASGRPSTRRPTAGTSPPCSTRWAWPTGQPPAGPAVRRATKRWPSPRVHASPGLTLADEPTGSSTMPTLAVLLDVLLGAQQPQAPPSSSSPMTRP